MSWKKIFRTARKVNAPVIIADEDGEKAQVVISLDKYESLMRDAYEFGDDFEDFEIDGVSEFDLDEDEIPELMDFDERDNEDIAEIEFDDMPESGEDDINEAELYHQYRKRRDEGYTSGEIMNQLENEGYLGSNSKTLPPEEDALSAFEIDEKLEKANKEAMDMSWGGEVEQFEAPGGKAGVSQEKVSQPSEELDTEDRFYFEPIEDEDGKV
ncbi:hypothetical protein GF391_02045 [Candidatus Uhrbacteria bacterium]|nr:hypothetical protein [Candidatus Uhrbacteria bacterium]